MRATRTSRNRRAAPLLLLLAIGCASPLPLRAKVKTVVGTEIPSMSGHKYVDYSPIAYEGFYPTLSEPEKKLIEYKAEKIKGKKVALVCSGGGLNLVFMIGALRALEDCGADVVALGGTSGGSIWCAAYALGIKPDEMTAFACAGRKEHYQALAPELPASVWDVLWPPWQIVKMGKCIKRIRGIWDSDYFGETLHQLYGDATFARCKRTLRVVTVDINTLSAKVYGWGDQDPRRDANTVPIHKAVQASCAIPAVFTPAKFNDVHNLETDHWDGGLVHNLPILEFLGLDTDLLFVCAVNCPSPAEIRALSSEAKIVPRSRVRSVFSQDWGLFHALRDAVDLVLRENIKKDVQLYYHSRGVLDGEKRKPIFLLNTCPTVELDEAEEIPSKILEGYFAAKLCILEYLRDPQVKDIYSNLP